MRGNGVVRVMPEGASSTPLLSIGMEVAHRSGPFAGRHAVVIGRKGPLWRGRGEDGNEFTIYPPSVYIPREKRLA